MTPAGVERGELVYSLPMAPKEKVTLSHKEWAVRETELTDVVQDYLENYSERGVAETDEIAIATQTEHRQVDRSGGAASNGVTLTAPVDSGPGISTVTNANSQQESRNHTRTVTSLTQPIFNRRQIRTQYEVAQAEQEMAFLEFRRALLVASREVSDALYNYETAVEKQEVIGNEYEAYDLATSYSEELLNNGFANYLEVLTARENALNTRLQLIDVRYTELNAIVNLYQALGGGWQ